MQTLRISSELIIKEEALIARAQKDPKDFNVLYEKYYKQIFLYIYNKVDEKQATADITSQVFLKAMVNIGSYKPQGVPFSAWLYRIASNETMQYFRGSNKVRKVIIDEDMLHRMAEESQGSDVEELTQHIEKIIHELPIEDIELVELRFYEGKSYKEIGFIKNMSEGNAKIKVWRIVEGLRKLIKNID